MGLLDFLSPPFSFSLVGRWPKENDRFGVSVDDELVFGDAGDFPGPNGNKFRNDLNVVFPADTGVDCCGGCGCPTFEFERVKVVFEFGLVCGDGKCPMEKLLGGAER